MRNRLYILLTLAFGIAAVQTTAQSNRGSVVIRNGTVLTVTKGTQDKTDVLIVDGKITQIGKGLSAPAGARVIDASGLFVMPGIIDPHSHIALEDINEATAPVTAEVFTGDAIDPMQVMIYRALAGGVTTIHAMHGSANAIGGQCETLKLRYGTTDPEALRMEGAPRTIKFALGENPTRVHGGGYGIVPRTRMGVEFVIRKAFSDARDYMAKWDKYNQDKLAKGFRGAPPLYNRRLETLADILRGQIIIHCHSYRADEINMMLKVCKDFGIKRIVFQHANEAFKIAPELAAQGAMASVFSDWWAYKFEVYYASAYNAAILVRNGVVTSVNSDDAELMRHLYHEAGKTQKYGGLTDDEAMALMTINPARQLGIDSRVGSIEVGKEGDVVIFKSHPLSIYALPLYTIVDGVVRFDKDKDPDDMRLFVDPTQSTETTVDHRYDAGVDRCMEGTDFLFGDLSTEEN
ncbi:MAG: amidohydrolase [Cyclobacteriaceae bacterium]|nr:amidohydrolase [Cyclobacteriaceae bacterium]